MAHVPRFRGMAAAAFAVAAFLALAGCSADRDRPASTLTEHQRDSVLARSSLPGAGAVGRALAESDRAARRAGALDSLAR